MRRAIYLLLILLLILLAGYGIIWYINVLNVRKNIYLSLNYSPSHAKYFSKFGYKDYKIVGFLKPNFILEFYNPILILTAEGEKIILKSTLLKVRSNFFSNNLQFTFPSKSILGQYADNTFSCDTNSSITYQNALAKNNEFITFINYIGSELICTANNQKYRANNIDTSINIIENIDQVITYDININFEKSTKEILNLKNKLTGNKVSSELIWELNNLNYIENEAQINGKGKIAISFSYKTLLESNLEFKVTKPHYFLQKFEGTEKYITLQQILQNYAKPLDNDSILLNINILDTKIYINGKEFFITKDKQTPATS